MNKKLIIAVSLITLSVFPAATLAVAVFNPGAAPRIPNSITDLWVDVIVNILRFIWPIFVGAAILMFLVAGFVFLTAAGDPNKVKLARDAMIYGVAGFVVGLVAFSLPYIIANTLNL